MMIFTKIKKWWFLIIAILFFFWLFFNLFSSRMLFPGDDGWYSGGSTWGDLALHLSLITSFSFGDNSFFSPDNPIYLGQKLSYPFTFNWFSAALVKSGLSLRWSLFVPSFILSLFLVGLICLLALKMTKNKISAFLAPFLFFFNGSIFGVYYFWQDFQKSQLGFFDFLGKITKQYARLEEANIYFTNLIGDFLLPQRTVIPGLVLGTLAICFLWFYLENKKKKNLLMAGLVTSILPSVHFHSFLAILIAGGILCLFEIIKNWKNIFAWLYFISPLIIFGLPQTFWILPSDSSSFLRWQFGWMKGQENFWWFWFKNLGVYLFLIPLAIFIVNRKLKIFYLSFLGSFLIFNLIVFQPWDYDNNKLMLFWFLLSCILIADFLGKILKKFSYQGLFIIIPVFILLVTTGILAVLREKATNWQLFSKDDILLAEFIKNNTPPKSIFLTSDKHNHPIPCLTGRRILMGYRGWLWTHGIKYQEREKDIALMYSGGNQAKDLLKEYKVNYVFIGPSEKYTFNVNEDFYAQNYPILIEIADTKIYKVQ